MATSSEATVTLKLLIDTKPGRVLFAEAGKDFVDFLLSLLQLPVATVVRLLTKQTMVGTLGNLYKTIQNTNETYFLSDQTKDSVLNPKLPLTTTKVPLLSLTTLGKTYYTCTFNNDRYNKCLHPYISGNSLAICPNCESSMSDDPKKESTMSEIIQYVAATNEVAEAEEGGFVKRDVTYMVMDDLEVTPMFTISGIEMLTKLKVVREVGVLEERVVVMGLPEGLKLLKASFQSNKVLTDVFLGNLAD